MIIIMIDSGHVTNLQGGVSILSHFVFSSKTVTCFEGENENSL